MKFPTLVIKTLLALLFFNAVVFPNAYQALTVGLLFVSALSILVFFPFRAKSISVSLVFLCAFVTSFYLLVGIINGAPSQAVLQTIFVYIVSPILWLIVLAWTFQNFEDVELQKWIARYSFLAATSLGLYYFLYLTFGAASVAFYNVNANVDLQDDYAGVVIHVSGSLIVLAAGYFAAPANVKNLPMRIVLLIALSLAVFTSGRSASILGLFIGIFVFFVRNGAKSVKTLALAIVILPLVVFVVAFAMSAFLSVDLFGLLQRHFEKVTEFGGSARTEQISSLVKGALDNYLLGAGHGLGTDYIRSFDFPWRYEAVPFALLYKVGLFGVVVYFYPFLAALASFLRSIGSASELDTFFGAALLAALVASVTNPYMEGFVFQWMFLAPVCYFSVNSGRKNKIGSHSLRHTSNLTSPNEMSLLSKPARKD